MCKMFAFTMPHSTHAISYLVIGIFQVKSITVFIKPQTHKTFLPQKFLHNYYVVMPYLYHIVEKFGRGSLANLVNRP